MLYGKASHWTYKLKVRLVNWKILFCELIQWLILAISCGRLIKSTATLTALTVFPNSEEVNEVNWEIELSFL